MGNIMDSITDKELEELKEAAVKISNDQIVEVLKMIARREVSFLALKEAADEETRQISIWFLAALYSAARQLTPGGWGIEDLDFIITPVQTDSPET